MKEIKLKPKLEVGEKVIFKEVEFEYRGILHDIAHFARHEFQPVLLHISKFDIIDSPADAIPTPANPQITDAKVEQTQEKVEIYDCPAKEEMAAVAALVKAHENKQKSTLKLRVGGVYRNRNNEIVKIVRFDEYLSFGFISDQHRTFAQNGKFNMSHRAHSLDLIEEVQPEEPNYCQCYKTKGVICYNKDTNKCVECGLMLMPSLQQVNIRHEAMQSELEALRNENELLQKHNNELVELLKKPESTVTEKCDCCHSSDEVCDICQYCSCKGPVYPICGGCEKLISDEKLFEKPEGNPLKKEQLVEYCECPSETETCFVEKGDYKYIQCINCHNPLKRTMVAINIAKSQGNPFKVGDKIIRYDRNYNYEAVIEQIDGEQLFVKFLPHKDSWGWYHYKQCERA